jgi:hypothetical protein
MNWEHPFVPYFHWLRTAKSINGFRIPGESNAFTKDFEYRRTEAYNTIFSRAFLFHSHRVLKLGGVAIRAAHFDNRNLDFVDLDHLAVSGRGTSWQTNIAYSSCRGVVFKNYEKPFVSFEKSPLDAPRFVNCQLERFEFIESNLSRPVFQNVRISRCELRQSVMGQPNFERCDFVDLKVIPPKRVSAHGLADFFKRLRVAFQAQGERGEVSRFYYEERFQRMRGHAVPIIPRGVPGLPGLAYADSLYSLYEQWKREQMTGKRVLELLRKNALRILTIFLYPPYLYRFVRAKAKLIPDLFDWLVWGFGERPIRIFYWMTGVIASFAVWYYMGTNQNLARNAAAALSCSAANFATLDCANAGAVDAAAEAIARIILLGLMVAGFSNRTRY